MAKQVLNNLDLASVFRTKLNENFTELYDGKQDKALVAQTAPTCNIYPFLQTGSTTNGRLIHYSKTPAAGAGAVTIRYIANTHTDETIRVVVTGSEIVVELATTAGNNAASAIQALLNATPAAYALCYTLLYLGDTGAGVLGATEIALNVQAFAGGVLGTVGYPGQIIYDTARKKWECAIDNYGGYLWIRNQGFPALNTAYPTMEFDTITGFRIWKMRRDFGALPNATTASVAHGLSVSRCIYLDGTFGSRPSLRTVYKLFSTYANGSFSPTYITITTASNLAAFSAYVDLYYTIEV